MREQSKKVKKYQFIWENVFSLSHFPPTFSSSSISFLVFPVVLSWMLVSHYLKQIHMTKLRDLKIATTGDLWLFWLEPDEFSKACVFLMNYKNEGPVQELYSSFGEISLDEIIFSAIRIKEGNNSYEDVITRSKGGRELHKLSAGNQTRESVHIEALHSSAVFKRSEWATSISHTKPLVPCCPGSDAWWEDQTGWSAWGWRASAPLRSQSTDPISQAPRWEGPWLF